MSAEFQHHGGRWVPTFMLVLVAIAAACLSFVPPTFGQVTVDSMVNNTNFNVPTSCVTNMNAYTVTIFNGFTSLSSFTIQLNCGGGTSQIGPYTVQPISSSQTYSIAPAEGGVGNRACMLSLIISNPLYNGGTPTQIRSFSSTCGTVVTNGATADCFWLNPICLIEINQCIGSFGCWWIIYFVLIVLGSAITAVIALAIKQSRQSKLVLPATPSSSRGGSDTSTMRSVGATRMSGAAGRLVPTTMYTHR